MISIDGNKIVLTRGDSACIGLQLEDGSGNPYDFSGDVVKFGLKRSVFNDGACILEKTFDSEGKIYFKPEDTEKMEFGDYLYDIQVTVTDDSGDEPVVNKYTPIAAAKFTLGFNVM